LQIAEDITPSCLFECPGLTVDNVIVDWLRTMDKGVLADVIGNVFWDALPKFTAGPRKEQVKVLWQYLLSFAARLAESFSDKDEHWRTVSTMTDGLLQLTSMNNMRPYDAEGASSLCQRVALLLLGLEMEALHAGATFRWRTKPKVHLMEELIEYQTCSTWCPL